MVNEKVPKNLISLINSQKSFSQNDIIKYHLKNGLTRKNFEIEFYQELINQKLESLFDKGFNLVDINKTLKSDFSIFYALEKKNKFYLIKVKKGHLLEDKTPIKEESRLIKIESQEIQERLGIKSHGLIYFISFLLNGKNKRKILEKELGVKFINLGAGTEFLKRRFRTYTQRQSQGISKERERISPYCAFRGHKGFIREINSAKCDSCKYYKRFILKNSDYSSYTPNE